MFSGQELIDARKQLEGLVNAGPSSAPILDMLAGTSDKQLKQIVDLWKKGGTDSGTDFVSAFEKVDPPEIGLKLDMDAANKELDHWAKFKTVTINVKWTEPGNTNWKLGGTLPGNDGKGTYQAHAAGGAVLGPGTGTSDSILSRLSNGEHIWTAAEVNAIGGHAEVERLRAYARSGSLPFLMKGVRQQAPQVVTVPVLQRNETHAPINVYTSASQIDDLEAQARRRRRTFSGG